MERLFKKYIHSVLTPDEFNEITDAFKQDKHTTSVFHWMEFEWSRFLNDPDAEKSNPLLWQRIRKIISLEDEAQMRRKLKLYTVALRVAAILVIGLLLTGVWFYYQTEQLNENINLQTVNIPFGARTQFQLPDGSTAWLN